jgi:uncharacterized protein (DUF488 family)
MKSTKMPDENLILTFGYGNRSNYDTFLGYIKKFNITCVIDVRRSPRAWSRKWYGDSLNNLCNSENIRYINKESLGNTSGCSHWIPAAQDEANQGLFEVAEIIKTENILLLCAEMDCSKCHRTEVASKLKDLTNASVKHLQ